MKVVIVTGFSGSGKSSVLNYLEDKNYYCVDNMPLLLIDKFLEILEDSDYDHVAIGIDVREYLINRNFDTIKKLKNAFVLFLDATTKELYKRYNESRRKHPIHEANLEKAIEREKDILSSLKKEADFILDTTGMKLKQLYKRVDNLLKIKEEDTEFFINITSFGFKYGNFHHAHLMLDVRFLPNPFFIQELKHKTGLDQDVYDYVLSQEDTKEFIQKTDALLDYLLPQYKKEGRHYLNIAIGCTGGKHRSVSIARYLHEKLQKNYHVTIRHQEIEKEQGE